MKRLNNSGFTIIETMLFLGISGLLIFGVMAGVGSSINAQRYRDSVVSLQSILQKQYSEVANVNNSGGQSCGATAANRGQSECVIIGRYITTDDGRVLTIKTVYLDKMPSTSAGKDDIVILDSSSGVRFKTFNTPETYEAEWGVSLNPMAFSILIIRSPSSGVIKTFIDSSRSLADGDIQSLVNAINLKSPNDIVKICVKPEGLFNGTPSAVIVNAGATNASGVETKGDNSEC